MSFTTSSTPFIFLSFRSISPLAVFSRTFEKAVVFVEMARRRTPHMGAPLRYIRLYTQSHRSRFLRVQTILISSSRRVSCAVCSQQRDIDVYFRFTPRPRDFNVADLFLLTY
uniref:Uncharacterized protein n=1 Tax=Rhipicephalus zambeziensis TaxID=60191 RepID=A0A224YA12_9ACAR